MRSGTSTRQALWPVLPLLAFLALVFIGPIARVLLWGVAPATAPIGATDAPWRELLATPLYRDALLRTFRLSLTVTLVCLILGYPVSYVLARTRGGDDSAEPEGVVRDPVSGRQDRHRAVWPARTASGSSAVRIVPSASVTPGFLLKSPISLFSRNPAPLTTTREP